MSSDQKHVAIGVTGSIAAYKSGDIIRGLDKEGWRISVLMTKEAEAFISPLTLGALSGSDVHREMFVDPDQTRGMAHIEVAQSSDVILIAPATANILAKLAYGMADNLIVCTVLASRVPVVVAPAMNDRMYHHPIVQANCARLRESGMHIVVPREGKLACGTYGEGHLADTEDIIRAVCSAVH